MNQDRVARLKAFIAEDPDDPFNHYALALEYLKTDAKLAFDQFDFLLSKHPDYLPTYYPFAHLLIEMGSAQRGEEVFKMGISRAKTVNDAKTMRELQAAYDDWMFLRE